MENTTIVLDKQNKDMVEEIAEKVGIEIPADSIDVNCLLNLLATLDDKYDYMEYKLNEVKEEFNNYQDMVADNYTPMSPYELYGVSPNDFH